LTNSESVNKKGVILLSVPSWDDIGIGVVRLYADKSHCEYYKVGAVFFRDKRQLSVGYNGPSSGEDHCDEVGCVKEINGKKLPSGSGLCRGAHAEMNAVANAAAEGISIKGTRIYCTYSPCYECAKVLANIPITEFIYEKEYKEDGSKALELFARRGIVVRQHKEGGK